VVHCRTVKGRGYRPAEDDTVDCLHSPGPFDLATGQLSTGPELPWTRVFGDEMVRIGAARPDVVAVTAAMLHPVGLHEFRAAYPDRTFDVGIAEQHAVTSAAGLAMGGLHPVVSIYSTFLNRAFDQVLMDVALHGLAVTLVLDRAGVTGNDGPSHHGMWDLSLLHLVPDLAVAAPRDAARLRQLLGEAVALHGPAALRFPKGAAPPDLEPADVVMGMDVLARYAGPAPCDPGVLIVAVGSMAHTCLQAATLLAGQGIGVTVADPRWVKPLPDGLSELAAGHRLVAVVEDSGRAGGTGDAVVRRLTDDGIDVPVRSFSIPQHFHAHGSRAQILAELGLDATRIAWSIAELAGRYEPAPKPPGARHREAYAIS
jgi:1-deoxy-D-xylulose-5-phosphate synthase